MSRQQAVTALGLVLILIVGMAATTWFYLVENRALFDDSFIGLHIAANIVEAGTARYFPVSGSQLFLASSPLWVLTLVPGFVALHALGMPIRTIGAAKIAFLTGGFVACLIFLPFWWDRRREYLAVSSLFFLLGPSLDSLFIMDGGVLFLAFATLLKLLIERSPSQFTVGVVALLVGLSRPEIGVVSAIACATVYARDRRALMRYASGLAGAFAVYCVVTLALGVYPIPSTVWSKQLIGRLKIFGEPTLLSVLPTSVAGTLGSKSAYVGWCFLLFPAVFSVPLRKVGLLVGLAVSAILAFAHWMPGNFAWYHENVMIVILLLGFGVAIELGSRRWLKTAALAAVILSASLVSILASNFGASRPYPWNEGSMMYRAYEEVGKSAGDDGTFVIRRYSQNPVRIRMCEIGIVSFFSGPDGWIDDLCGLAQVGNLRGASDSWLRFFYPATFTRSGDDELAQFVDRESVPVIDVWAFSNPEEAASAKGRCLYADDSYCINPYRRGRH